MKKIIFDKWKRRIFEVQRTWAAMLSNRGFFYALHIMPLVSVSGLYLSMFFADLGKSAAIFFAFPSLKSNQ